MPIRGNGAQCLAITEITTRILLMIANNLRSYSSVKIVKKINTLNYIISENGVQLHQETECAFTFMC